MNSDPIKRLLCIVCGEVRNRVPKNHMLCGICAHIKRLSNKPKEKRCLYGCGRMVKPYRVYCSKECAKAINYKVFKPKK